MGKGLKHRDSGFTRESNSPGCMFRILNHLNHHQHRWHQVRKCLPHINQSGGKHVPGDLRSNATATDIPEKVVAKVDDSPIVVKKAGAQSKSSIKSRLKALITKELSRRKKVRHRRSVFCPSTECPLNDKNLMHPQNEHSSIAGLLDQSVQKTRKECDSKQSITDFTLRRTQSLYFSKGRTKDASPEESKLFLNALDLLNMRQEVFQKILRDPNSSLAHSLHCTQPSKGLTKSVSFPSVKTAMLCSKDDVSKKEKHRIVMDGVLHKVPNDRNVPESSCNSAHYSVKSFKRTSSSLNESVDRYNRLLEPCSSKEDTNQCPEKSGLRASTSSAVVMERILSLPNLRNFRIEDSEILDTAAASSDNLEQTQEDSILDSKILETSLDVSEYSDDLSENFFTVELDRPVSIPLPDVIFQEIPTAPEDIEGTDEEGIPNPLQIQVDERNKAEFNYVKDVLELSGYTGNEFLEKWQSTNWPMNVSAFEEGHYDQLLLYDLINEVLLQLYERTSLYWPKALMYRSSIRTIPVGYHLLEQVWTDISWCLGFKVMNDQLLLDDALSHDLAKCDCWMNLQFDAECVGLELEDLIFDDLLDELIFIY